jgi:hypothetical protein
MGNDQSSTSGEGDDEQVEERQAFANLASMLESLHVPLPETSDEVISNWVDARRTELTAFMETTSASLSAMGLDKGVVARIMQGEFLKPEEQAQAQAEEADELAEGVGLNQSDRNLLRMSRALSNFVLADITSQEGEASVSVSAATSKRISARLTKFVLTAEEGASSEKQPGSRTSRGLSLADGAVLDQISEDIVSKLVEIPQIGTSLKLIQETKRLSSTSSTGVLPMFDPEMDAKFNKVRHFWL